MLLKIGEDGAWLVLVAEPDTAKEATYAAAECWDKLRVQDHLYSSTTGLVAMLCWVGQ